MSKIHTWTHGESLHKQTWYFNMDYCVKEKLYIIKNAVLYFQHFEIQKKKISC